MSNVDSSKLISDLTSSSSSLLSSNASGSNTIQAAPASTTSNMGSSSSTSDLTSSLLSSNASGSNTTQAAPASSTSNLGSSSSTSSGTSSLLSSNASGSNTSNTSGNTTVPYEPNEKGYVPAVDQLIVKPVEKVISIQALGETVLDFDPAVDQLKISPVLKSQLNLDTVSYQDGVISANQKDSNKPVVIAYLIGNPEISRLKEVLQLEPRLESSSVKRFLDFDLTSASASPVPPQHAITDVFIQYQGSSLPLVSFNSFNAARTAYDDANGNGDATNKVFLSYNPGTGNLSYVDGEINWQNYVTSNMNIHIIGLDNTYSTNTNQSQVSKLVYKVLNPSGPSGAGPVRVNSIILQGVDLSSENSDSSRNYLNRLYDELNKPSNEKTLDIGNLVSMPLTWYNNDTKTISYVSNSTDGLKTVDANNTAENTTDPENPNVVLPSEYETDILQKDSNASAAINISQKATSFLKKQLDYYLHNKENFTLKNDTDLVKVWKNAEEYKNINAAAKTLGFASSLLKVTDGLLSLFDGNTSNDAKAAINIISGALNGAIGFREALDAIVKATGSKGYLEKVRKAVANDVKSGTATDALRYSKAAFTGLLLAPIDIASGIKSIAEGDISGGLFSIAGAFNTTFEAFLKAAGKNGKTSKFLKYSGAAGPYIMAVKVAISISKAIKAKAEYQQRQIDLLNAEVEKIYDELAPQLKQAGFDDFWLSAAYMSPNYGSTRSTDLQLQEYYPKNIWASDHKADDLNALTRFNIFVRLMRLIHGVKNEGQLAAASSDYISQYSFDGNRQKGGNLERQFYGMSLGDVNANGVPPAIQPQNARTPLSNIDYNMAVFKADGSYSQIKTGNGDNQIFLGSDNDVDKSNGGLNQSNTIGVQGGSGTNEIDVSVPRIPIALNYDVVNGKVIPIPRTQEKYFAPSIDGGSSGENIISFKSAGEARPKFTPTTLYDAKVVTQTSYGKEYPNYFPIVGEKVAILLDLSTIDRNSSPNSPRSIGIVQYVPLEAVYWSVRPNIGFNDPEKAVLSSKTGDDPYNPRFSSINPNYVPAENWPINIGSSPNPDPNISEPIVDPNAYKDPDLRYLDFFTPKNSSIADRQTLNNLIQSVQTIKGFDKITGTGQGDDIVTSLNQSNSINGIGGNNFLVTPKNVVGDGTGISDSFSGGSGDDTIIARRKSNENLPQNKYIYNSIQGGGGDDYLIGKTGQNLVDPDGPGHTIMSGDLGDSKNIYFFGRGYQSDTIDFTHTYDYGNWTPNGSFFTDYIPSQKGRLLPLNFHIDNATTKPQRDYSQTIYLKDDITIDQLNFSRNVNNDVVIGFDGHPEDTLTIQSGNLVNGDKTGISKFVLSDGTIISGVENISKNNFRSNKNSNSTIQASATYSSFLIGGGGNHTFSGSNGNDIIVPGPGNNVINPSSGNDTIVVGRGAGQDTIKLNQNSGNVTVQFEGSINLDDLQFGLNNGQFQISVGYRGNFDLSNQKIVFDSTQDNLSKIKDLKFANGLDLPVGSNLLNNATSTTTSPLPTGGNDNISANQTGLRILSGGFGNDTLTGSYGNDTIIGGDGNNLLRPGEADYFGTERTYVIQEGSGFDTIEPRSSSTDKVVFCSNKAESNLLDPNKSLLPGDVWFKQDGNDLLAYLKDEKHGVRIKNWDPTRSFLKFDVVNQVEGTYEVNSRQIINSLLPQMSRTGSSGFEAPWTPTEYYSHDYQNDSSKTFPQIQDVNNAIKSAWTLTPFPTSIF